MDCIRPIYLCGPTASGKSGAAVAFAKHCDFEIVNGDAFQLYRGLPILTAAPTADELATVPHHLFGILTPDQPCNAMKFRTHALGAIEEIISRGKVPLVVGGSGLYLKFLTHGPSPLPTANQDLRQQLDQLSLLELVSMLEELDPVEASRTALANRRYVTRAIEICRLSGQKCSDLRDQWEITTTAIGNQLQGVYFQRERQDLHQRIEQRTRWMLENGAIEEVCELGSTSENFAKAIGLNQIRAHLAGEIDYQNCLETIVSATRRYAKRQESWFRREIWLKKLICPPTTIPSPELILNIL